MTQPVVTDAELEQKINGMSVLFDEFCQHRHEVGAEEYGNLTFLENDVVRMMCEELADVANYARYHFIKLLLLQEGLDEPTIGAQAFKGTGEGWSHERRGER